MTKLSNEFMVGVCHPGNRTDLIREAGLTWLRLDVPFPFKNYWGELSCYYREFVERAKGYVKEGFRIMGITPYPRDYITFGVDPRNSSQLVEAARVCEFLASDLGDLVAGWQVSNELNLIHFRSPLTLKEAAQFLVLGLEGIRKGNRNAIIGINSSGLDDDARWIITEVLKRCELIDYIGFDAYYGTWSSGGTETFVNRISELYDLAGKPVIIQEFGFASGGEALMYGDFARFLESYGYNSMEEAEKRINEFVQKLPDRIRNYLLQTPETDWKEGVKTYFPHLMKKWPGASTKHAHTLEGQADFMDELIPLLLQDKRVSGAFFYCWNDSERCYLCGEEDCPCETNWGITDFNENPKPVYDIFKKYFGKKF